MQILHRGILQKICDALDLVHVDAKVKCNENIMWVMGEKQFTLDNR